MSKPKPESKPGFYWVRVIKYGPNAYLQWVVGEYSSDKIWDVIGWPDARFDDKDLEVLSDRLSPPKKKGSK